MTAVDPGSAGRCGQWALPSSTRCRYDDGVSPQYCANARANELTLSNPTAVDTSLTDRPDAPEHVHDELVRAGADDDDIHKITWQNSSRFFNWDPFALVPREQATVGARRALATDVDVSIRARKEWARLYAERRPKVSA